MERRYPRDRWLFRIVYPLMALAVVHVGNDNSLAELLRLPSYYSDLALSLLLTFGTGLYFRWYYRRHRSPLSPRGWVGERLGEYLAGVLALPVAVLIAVECLYVVGVLGIPFSETSIPYLELPLIILFCLLINAVYLIVGLRAAVQEGGAGAQDKSTRYPGQFVVHAGTRSRSISVGEIAYFELVDKVTFLVSTGGERFVINQSLRELESGTDPNLFFLLNRQLLAHRRSVEGYARTDTRKLRIDLLPPPVAEHFVAKTKVTAFLGWLAGQTVASGEA